MPAEKSTQEGGIGPAINTTNEPSQKRKQSELVSSDEVGPDVQSRHKRPRAQDEQAPDELSPTCTNGDSPEEKLPQNTDEDYTEYARDSLSHHIQDTTAMFFLELTPSSIARGAGCKLPDCNSKIKEGCYRIAVYPGMCNDYKSSDFYHVKCFEKLADLSKPDYLRRLQPLTRFTFPLRDIKGTSIMDGNYLVDGGAERLVLQWIYTMEGFIAKRDKIEQSPLDRDLEDILLKAGSATFSPKKPEAMSNFEFLNLCHTLAPIESDGAEDQDEWNLFDDYLPSVITDFKDLEYRHSLSLMLQFWHTDKFLANAHVDRLTDKGKEARTELGDKAIKGIRRLSVIPMPDFQSVFLRNTRF